MRDLDGQALLYKIHALRSSHRDSIVYWLEFKNDEEFPTMEFGSISGGSALKYGIYQRKEDGVWITGSSQNQQELTEGEAIEVARRHRDQLLRSVELLNALPPGAGDEAYRRLQKHMNEAAPDIVDSVWSHKYFHLLFPEKLDDYHVEYYQRFHLIKLLQVPPTNGGRYVCGGRFVNVAAELDMPMNHLAKVLNERNGRPYSYWRIGTRLGGDRSIWDMMRRENSVAIGWPDVGDLSNVAYDRESKLSIRQALQTNYYPNHPHVLGRKTQEIFNFVTKIDEGDVVLPSDGKRVLGIGRVVGGYAYVPGSEAPHRRPVEWLSLGQWPMAQPEGLQTTVSPVRRHDVNRVEVEKRILEAPGVIQSPPSTERPQPPPRLKGIPGRIQAVLDRKKEVILHGPPGTGKTYWSRKAAQDLAALSRFARRFDELAGDERQALVGGSAAPVRMCTFHPAYGYEDFLEGFRPDTVNQQLVFEQRDGIFKRLCKDADADPGQDFYLVIDEINRGDIPRIFGELLTILEADKRGQEILLPLSGEAFSVPQNVYIIATMNTADRSIALLDTALRRRFGFIELMPDVSVLEGVVMANTIPLGPWLATLNERILEYIGRDARNLQIGHAYLLQDGRPVADFQRFARVLREDIIPLLQEYCYEDYPALERILGDGLIDVGRQRIRQELFETEKRDALVQALLKPAPELATSSEVVASEAESQQLEAEEEMVVDEEDAAA